VVTAESIAAQPLYMNESKLSSLNIESNILLHPNFGITITGLVRMVDGVAGY